MDLYGYRSQFVLGFHGCDSSLAKKVVSGDVMLSTSNHDYDWLGHGIYFWENNHQRAMEWAIDNSRREGSSINDPGVIGAYLDLGHCLDLTDSEFLKQLVVSYKALEEASKLSGIDLPVNEGPARFTKRDRILRKLDCAVIESLHVLNKNAGLKNFDSVRGVFWEGKELYPGAGFMEKNHIQIAIINPNCIKGFFLPRELDDRFPNV